jgi:ATP-dependent Clp endopeptidase proteolytic subunit ClpP
MKYNLPQNIMVKDNTISLLGVIGEDWWEESNTSNEFLRLMKDMEKKHSTINIEINSPGGSMYHGSPIYNAIKSSKAETVVTIIGMAASMGAIIALAGDKVRAYKNAVVMLHSPLNALFGNAKEFRAMADTLDVFAEGLIETVADRTGQSKEETKNTWFDYEDHFLSASQALEAGLIDEIVDQEADVPENASDMEVSDLMKYYENKYKPQKPGNFIQNIINSINTPNKMKIDKKILDKLSLAENATIEEVVASITNRETELSTAKNSLTEAQNQVTDLNDQVQNLTTERDNANNNLQTAQDSLTAAEQERTQLTEAIDQVDETVANAEGIEAKLEAFNKVTDPESGSFVKKDPENHGEETPHWMKTAEQVTAK